jgi:hypothetical protein
MPIAEFEPTIPVFKRAKTFHTLDRAATLTGNIGYNTTKVELSLHTKEHRSTHLVIQ